MFKLSAFAGYLTKSLGRIKQSPGINRSAMFTQVHLFLTVNRKVAEAGVILAGSSNQTNFSLLTSEAGVAPDQRLKLGQLAFQAELFPISIPFILHSIPGLPEAGRIVGSPVSAAAAVPYARPVKGVLAPSFHWDLCPAPSSRDDLNTEKKKWKAHHSKESGTPSSFRAGYLSSTFTAASALSCSTAFGFCPGP